MIKTKKMFPIVCVYFLPSIASQQKTMNEFEWMIENEECLIQTDSALQSAYTPCLEKSNNIHKHSI